MDKENNLTRGNETKAMLIFALPLILGNIFQQLYNVADSIIVGQFIGSEALAAVGSAFTLMVFLTSIVLGLCMGASVYFSHLFGAGNQIEFKNAVVAAFLFIGGITICLNILVLVFTDSILRFTNIPPAIYGITKEYLTIILYGMFFVFLYNFFSSVLRSVGNSFVPLILLIFSAVLNVILDILFVSVFKMGVSGAAFATIIAQCVSGIASGIYCFFRLPYLKGGLKEIRIKRKTIKQIMSYALLASIQQSMMNFGILMIQGLVNSFGIVIMAAFSAASKIESFAYMPVQEYGNTFATYTAQNLGAGKTERIRKGIKSSFWVITGFCIIISIIVVNFAPNLMLIFIKPQELEIIREGVHYLQIVGMFYCLIGYLFSFYGYYRGMGTPQVSILLTVISLGLRVALAYLLAPVFGVRGIWWSIPIGWFISDLVGLILLKRYIPRPD